MSLAQVLKNSILQAAMQGKLTERLETDSSAENMLDKIKDAMAAAFPNRKIKYPTHDLSYDIPDSWCYASLETILSISSGTGLTAKRMVPGNIPVFGGNGITGYHNKHNIEKKTIVIGRVGANCGCVHITPEKAWVTDNAFIVTYPYDLLNMDYLTYALESLNLGSSARATAQPVISGKSVYPNIIPLPPIEEQQRIVDRVNELLAKVDEFEKIENRLTAVKEKFPSDLRAAILQAAMQGKLTEQLDTDSSVDDLLEKIKPSEHPTSGKGKRKSKSLNIEFFDIPETWRWVKLSECGTTNIGLTYSPSDVSLTDGTIVLRSSNIQNGAMDYNDIVRVNMTIPENKMCHIGDILICARNGSKRLVGKSAIIDKEGMAFGAFMAIYRSKCNPYINYVLESPHFRKSVLGGAETTTINQVTQDMLENYMFPLPPIEEQQRIVKRLDALLPLCDELTEE